MKPFRSSQRDPNPHLYAVKARGSTPAIEESSALGAKEREEEVSTELASAQREQKWLKDTCLLRDGNKCALTRLYDADRAVKISVHQDQGTVITEAAHIIPYSTGHFSEPEVSHFNAEPTES